MYFNIIAYLAQSVCLLPFPLKTQDFNMDEYRLQIYWKEEDSLFYLNLHFLNLFYCISLDHIPAVWMWIKCVMSCIYLCFSFFLLWCDVYEYVCCSLFFLSALDPRGENPGGGRAAWKKEIVPRKTKCQSEIFYLHKQCGLQTTALRLSQYCVWDITITLIKLEETDLSKFSLNNATYEYTHLN